MQAGPVVRPGMAQVGSCRVAPCLDVLWIAAAAGEMLERPAEARSDDVSLAPGHVLDRPVREVGVHGELLAALVWMAGRPLGARLRSSGCAMSIAQVSGV